MPYKIYMRDESLNRIAEVDDFTALTMIPRFNNVGNWNLTIPFKVARQKGIAIGNVAGIVVTRDDEPIMSGPVRSLERQWSTTGDVLAVGGVDDLTYLSQRLAYPVPTGPPYSSQAYDVRSGAAETVMRQYVDFNAGPSAQSQRAALTLASDQGRGKAVTGRARFDNLLVFLQALALAGGDMGFRVIQVGSGLQFQVYQPTDKTASVIFSPLLGNLRDFKYSEQASTANYVIAGGGGQGTARTFVESGDSASISIYGRMEEFIDQRNTTVISELQQAVNNDLSQNAYKTQLSITPVDTAAISFGRDYFLGDKVSVVASDKSDAEQSVIQDIMREVRIDLTKDGEVILPTISTPDPNGNAVLKMFSDMKKLSKRVNNLERGY